MIYDLLPVLALWMLLSLVVTLAWTWLGNHDVRENIAPFSLLQWLLWLGCWLLTGAYAVFSWQRGGQTLGMRPWRLRVVAADGSRLAASALWVRYAVATLSLAAAGLGFLWALFDRERLTWHDRVSHTRLIRQAAR